MFQYANALSISHRLNTTLYLDLGVYSGTHGRSFELSAFSISAIVLPNHLQWLYLGGSPNGRLKRFLLWCTQMPSKDIQDLKGGYDDRVARIDGSWRLVGYWQSEKYFLSIRDRLLEEFTFRKRLSPGLSQLIREMESTESVAIHVRRGDYVSNPSYGVLTADYYRLALAELGKLLHGPKLFVFSDDTAWAIQNIPGVSLANLVSGARTRTAAEDLVAMSHCKHFIIANSTFSWWGAWLGKYATKLVLAPKNFFCKPRPWEVDLVPAEWIRVENDFCA